MHPMHQSSLFHSRTLFNSSRLSPLVPQPIPSHSLTPEPVPSVGSSVSPNSVPFQHALALQNFAAWLDGFGSSRLKSMQNPSTVRTSYFSPTLSSFGRFKSQTRKMKETSARGTETVNRTTLVVFSLVKEFHSASKLDLVVIVRKEGQTCCLEAHIGVTNRKTW